MAQIRIDTEHTREVGRRLIAEGDRLAEIGHELQRAIGSLDTWAWDGRSRWRAEPLLSRVRPESTRVADGLDALGRKLVRVADTFEQEDDTAARNLEGMGWVDFAVGSGSGAGLSATTKTPDGTAIDESFELRSKIGAITAGLAPLIFGIPGFLITMVVVDSEYYENWLVSGHWFKYKDLGGQLYDLDKGPELDDIEQGPLGDCYLIAGIGAIAHKNPHLIRNMIHDNENGTYTVTFYELDANGNPAKPVKITVDGTLPTQNGKTPCFASSTDEGERWPAIIEKAYVKWKGGEGDYEDIEGGYLRVLSELTGAPITSYFTAEHSSGEIATKIEGALQKGLPVMVGTNKDSSHGLVGKHAYVVERVYKESGVYKVELHNPHGKNHATLTMDELCNSSHGFAIGGIDGL